MYMYIYMYMYMYMQTWYTICYTCINLEDYILWVVICKCFVYNQCSSFKTKWELKLSFAWKLGHSWLYVYTHNHVHVHVCTCIIDIIEHELENYDFNLAPLHAWLHVNVHVHVCICIVHWILLTCAHPPSPPCLQVPCFTLRTMDWRTSTFSTPNGWLSSWLMSYDQLPSRKGLQFKMVSLKLSVYIILCI